MKLKNLLYIITVAIIISCSENIEQEEEQVTPPTNQFSLIESRQIPLPFTTIDEILKLEDGYLFFSSAAKINIAKTNKNFEVLWSLEIKSTGEDLFYSGAYALNNKNEYLIFYNGYSGTKEDPYGNTYGINKSANILKFNASGQEIWRKNYATQVKDNFYVKSNDVVLGLSKYSEKPKFIIKSDSTYYTNNDEYHRILDFDTEGNIVKEEILNDIPLYFGTVLFKENGDWISYKTINGGTINSQIKIEKYNQNNQLGYSHNFSNSSKVSELLYTNNNIIVLGTKQFMGYNLGFGARWLFKSNESNGQLVWELEDNKEGFSYRSKDLILDNEGNYLSLYMDSYNERYEGETCCIPTFDVSYTTLIKSDQEGKLIWKFVDKGEHPNNNFNPQRVFQEGEEYLIIGEKINKGMWLKKIKKDK